MNKNPLLSHSWLSMILAIVLAGCSTTDEEVANMKVEDLYLEAHKKIKDGSYSSAAKLFAEVERQHPYSNWSLKAQLMSAYAYYEAKKYDEAIESFNTFIQLHPGHEQIAYAYYMIGLCNYEQIPTVQRDQSVTERALEAFEEVVRRFPDSSYARDAKYKIDLIYDHLAGKEMDVARYYLRQKSYLPAINRFKKVVDEFQTSSHTPEALHRMVECYLALGIPEQARVTAAVLGYNYPGSPWYADTYALVKHNNPKADLPAKRATTVAVKAAPPQSNLKPSVK